MKGILVDFKLGRREDFFYPELCVITVSKRNRKIIHKYELRPKNYKKPVSTVIFTVIEMPIIKKVTVTRNKK